MVPRAGVEPAASPLGGVRSIRLSYRGIWQKIVNRTLNYVIFIRLNNSINAVFRYRVKW
jgi:hypothetical protein